MKKNNQEHIKDRREHFRLKYQVEDRPKLELENGSIFDVIDVSEHGLRFRYVKGLVENPIKGRIIFGKRDELTIEGKLLRIHNGEICLHVDKSIPMRLLVEEQRYLHKKYGMVLEGDVH
jgi:hypothetical protein